MGAQNAIQSILLYTQIAELFLKVFLFLALLILVVVAISYLAQRKRLDLEFHEKKMKEDFNSKVFIDKPVDDTLFAKDEVKEDL